MREKRMVLSPQFQIVNQNPALVITARAQTALAKYCEKISRVAESEVDCLDCSVPSDNKTVYLRWDGGCLMIRCETEAQRTVARRISHGLKIVPYKQKKQRGIVLLPC